MRHFLFGRVEVRARITPGNGYFPAIWTCGYNRNWPANGEIDIMEHYWLGSGKEVLTANFAVSKCNPNDIYDTNWNSTFTPLTYWTDKDPDWMKKYHVWRMDWDEETITLYLDGEKRNSIKIREMRNGDGTIAFYNPQYMWLNLALKDFGHGIDQEQHFEVDYFRVYQRSKDVDAPSPVSDLHVTEAGDTWAEVEWSPATDNVGVYRYDIYVDGMGSTKFQGSTTACAFTWNSSDETVMTATGLVNLPTTPRPVTLTAHCNGHEDRTFYVTVHPRNVTHCLLLYYPFEAEDTSESGQGDMLVTADGSPGANLDSWAKGTAWISQWMSIWSEMEMGCLLYLIVHIKKRPALVRWSSGSVAGSVGAKVLLLFKTAKHF